MVFQVSLPRPWRLAATAWCCLLVLPLSGFSWSLLFGQLDWPKVELAITREYPGVRQITVEQLQARIARGERLLLVDVREGEEYRLSHIPTAISVDDFHPQQHDPGETIIVYCSVGLRSASYAEQLQKKGHSSVFNLAGSIFRWANSGLPLEDEAGGVVTRVHPYDKRWGELLLPQYRAELPVKH